MSPTLHNTPQVDKAPVQPKDNLNKLDGAVKGIYTVQPGQGQWAIAKDVGVDLQRLTSMNPSFVGQYPSKIRVLHPYEPVELLLPAGSASKSAHWKPSPPTQAVTAPPVAKESVATNANPVPSEKGAPTVAVQPSERPLYPVPEPSVGGSLQRASQHAQLAASRFMVQGVVPNFINGNLQAAALARQVAPAGLPFPRQTPDSPERTPGSPRWTPDSVTNAKKGLAAPAAALIAKGGNALVLEHSFDTGSAFSTNLKIYTDHTAPKFRGEGSAPPLGSVTNPPEWTLAKTDKHNLYSWIPTNMTYELSGRDVKPDGTVQRSATINVAVTPSLEYLGVNSEKANMHTLRQYHFLEGGLDTSYQVTTNEKRLKDIVTGKLPLPDPFTLQSMKVGDQVTLNSGWIASAQGELRFFGGRGVEGTLKDNPSFRTPGPAVDVKGDSSVAQGRHIVINAIEADAVTGAITRVVVMSGETDRNIEKFGVGGIFNTGMAKSAKDEKDWGVTERIANRGEKLKVKSGFARALVQGIQTHNGSQSAVMELDLTNPQGMAIFQRMVTASELPALEKNQSVPGLLAHGHIDLTLDKFSTSAQISGYVELIAGPNRHTNTAAGWNWEMTANTRSASVLKLDHAEEGSKLCKMEGFCGPDSEITTITKQLNHQTVRMDVAKNANGKFEYQNLGSGTYGVPERAALEIFSQAATRESKHMPPAYGALTLRTPGEAEPLRGQDAVSHLKIAKASRDEASKAHWYSVSSEPDVNMSFKVQEGANHEALAKRLASDVKTHMNKEREKMFDGIGRTLITQAKLDHDVNELIVSELGLMPAQASNFFKEDELSRATDPIKLLDALYKTDPSSFIRRLEAFHQAGGNQEPYPIDVEYRSDY